MFGEGKSGFVYPFRYTYLIDKSSAEGEPVEVLFSVPKKFHKRANKRNLLKRRTREAFRQSPVRDELRVKVTGGHSTLDLALIYSTKELHSYKTINNAVQRILGQIGEGL